MFVVNECSVFEVAKVRLVLFTMQYTFVSIFQSWGEHRGYLLKVFAVGRVEGGEVFAVDIEYGYDVAPTDDRYYYLAATQTGTGYVTREGIDVGNDEGLALSPSCATYSFAFGYSCTSQRTLKWTENEFAVHDAIEAGPPESECLMQHTRHICHVGYEVALATYYCLYLG